MEAPKVFFAGNRILLNGNKLEVRSAKRMVAAGIKMLISSVHKKISVHPIQGREINLGKLRGKGENLKRVKSRRRAAATKRRRAKKKK